MLRQTLYRGVGCQAAHRLYSTKPPPNKYAKAVPVAMIVIGGAATFAGSFMVRQNSATLRTESKLFSDKESIHISEQTEGLALPQQTHSQNELTTYAWGSNRYGTSTATSDTVKVPFALDKLSGMGVALRDLAFHQKHAACVDAAGNLYQWGEAFHGAQPPGADLGPLSTLKGKNIVSVSLSADKVYALSKSGTVYVVSAHKNKQATSQSTTNEPSSWWGLGWFQESKPTVDFIELKAEQGFAKGERLTSISAGRSHLLALTSSGRTFVCPISSSANSHGQLGTRKVQLGSVSPSGASTRVSAEFIPKSQGDPYARTTPVVRTNSSTSAPVPGVALDEADIRYCDLLFEVPALKGVVVEQAVAGDRSSYVRTKTEGRVLGWGANEYGQIGLGSTFAVEYVPIPTEIVMSRAYPTSTAIKCLNIASGGNMAYFTVQHTTPSSTSSAIDLLACGMGQFGSLGNNLFTQSQGSLVRVKSISGIQEFDDRTQSLQPLAPKTISVSPTHHVIVSLDTIDTRGLEGRSGRGRDIMVWGLNSDYQLGLKGKRSNMPQPTLLPSDAFVVAGEWDVDPRIGRMLLRERTVDVLRDLEGNKIKKNAKVEQTAVAGWGCSAIYWKVV